MITRLLRIISPLYVFLYSFLLISQYGKHFFFSFSYLSGIRIDYLAPTLYLMDILSFPFVIIFILKLKQLYKKHLINIIRIIPILFLIGINYYFALSKPLWFYGLLRILEWISIFYFFLSWGKNKQIYSALVLGIFFGGMCELILSLLQLSSRHSIQGWWYYLGERSFSIFTPGIAKAYFMGSYFLRPYGTFSHPNSLAGFYLLVYTFILTQKRVTNIVLKTILLTISSALILISFSRTAIVLYALITILYFLKNSFTCKACLIAKAITTAALILFALNISGDVNSFQKRNDFMQKSLSIIAQKPLSGTGLGSYLIAQHHYPQKFSTFFEQPVHNIFLLAIAQLGIPLSLLLIFILTNRLNREHIKPISLLLPLLVIVLTGCVDHYWLTLQQNILVTAVLFGIIVGEHDIFKLNETKTS